MSEYFYRKSKKRDEAYLRVRNSIIAIYEAMPFRRLYVHDLLRVFSGDVAPLLRISQFLEKVGILTRHVHLSALLSKIAAIIASHATIITHS